MRLQASPKLHALDAPDNLDKTETVSNVSASRDDRTPIRTKTERTILRNLGNDNPGRNATDNLHQTANAVSAGKISARDKSGERKKRRRMIDPKPNQFRHQLKTHPLRLLKHPLDANDQSPNRSKIEKSLRR